MATTLTLEPERVFISDSADELTEVEGEPLEQATKKAQPLMVDLSITVLHSVEGEYMSVMLGKFLIFACKFSCKSKRTPEEMVRRRDKI